MPQNVKRENVAGEDRDDGGAVAIYATFPDIDAAERIGGHLVEAGLAACVNVMPGMRSIYRWQGALQRDAEVAALIKTRRSLAPRVVGWLRIAHPYVTPAALVLPVVGGSPAYLAWIEAETAAAARGG